MPSYSDLFVQSYEFQDQADLSSVIIFICAPQGRTDSIFTWAAGIDCTTLFTRVLGPWAANLSPQPMVIKFE
jgi:hypothetical protein